MMISDSWQYNMYIQDFYTLLNLFRYFLFKYILQENTSLLTEELKKIETLKKDELNNHNMDKYLFKYQNLLFFISIRKWNKFLKQNFISIRLKICLKACA